MHVHLDQFLAAFNQSILAHGLQFGAHLVHGMNRMVCQELDVEAVFNSRNFALGIADGHRSNRFGRRIEFGNLHAPETLEQTFQVECQAPSTGVHDAGLLQDRQEFRGALNRIPGFLTRRGQHGVEADRHRHAGHMLRNVPGHGQHRTFPRFGHGGLRLSGSRRQRLRQHGGIQTPGRCHLRGEAIHELAEDDTGIAPRAGQGSLRGPGPDGPPGVVRTRTADSLRDRLQRQCQVGAGIAVGDRKHVFAV